MVTKQLLVAIDFPSIFPYTKQINGFAHSSKYLLWLLYSSRKKVIYILHGLEVSKQSGNFCFRWTIPLHVQTFPLTLNHNTIQCIIQNSGKTPVKNPHGKFLRIEISHCAVFLQNFLRGKETLSFSHMSGPSCWKNRKAFPRNPRLRRHSTISALVVHSEQKYSTEESERCK